MSGMAGLGLLLALAGLVAVCIGPARSIGRQARVVFAVLMLASVGLQLGRLVDRAARPAALGEVYVVLEHGIPLLWCLFVYLAIQYRSWQRLSASERWLRQLVETAEEGVWTVDPDGVTSFVNDKAAQMLGYRPEEMIGRPVFDFLQGEWVDEARRVMSEHQRGAVRMVTDFRLRHRDGRPIWALVANCALLDEAGGYVGSMGMLTDITERKRAEEALATSEQRFRRLAEETGVGIWEVDPANGDTRYINPAMCDLLGVPGPEGLVGEHYREFFTPSSRELIDQELPKRRRGEPSSLEVRLECRRDGSTRECLMSGAPIFDEAGRLQSLIGSFIDIGERKTQQIERAELEQQLRHAQKMELVGRLAGGLAHDFNNLLTPILAYSDKATQRLPEGSALHRELGAVRDAAVQASGLVRELLSVARSRALERQVLSLDQQARRLQQVLRGLLPEHVELMLDLQAERVCVSADPTQMQQVLVNLTVNAGEAMPDGGRIRILTRDEQIDEMEASSCDIEAGRYLRLVVSDDGVGMDAETMAHIFEPFFTTKGREQGTGLGLATVYGIVRQHGGGIHVDSRPGAGSRIIVLLPISEAGDGAGDDGHSDVVHEGGSENILVVEDNAAVRELTLRLLRGAGYRVSAVDSAEAAIAHVAAHGPIDLLVSDLLMPGSNGRELAERLLREHPQLRVLFISGQTDRLIDIDRLDPRCAFLGKPFELARLLAVVRDLLDRRSLATVPFPMP